MLLLIACDATVKIDDTAADSGEETDGETDGETSGDTSGETGGDSGDDTGDETGDSGDETGDSGGDTGETGAAREDLTFLVDGEVDGLGLNLVGVLPQDDGIAFGEVWLATEVEESVLTVTPGDPPALYRFEVDPKKYPGLLASYAAPVLHVDENGDWAHDEGERLTAVGETWALWLGPGVPPQLEKWGLYEGWNALDVFDGEPRDPEAIAVVQNLLPTLELTVSGDYAAPEDIAGQRLVSLPYAALAAGTLPDPLLWDEDLTDPFSVTVRGEPAPETLVELAPGYFLDPEILVAYEDGGDPGFDLSDTLLSFACFEGDLAGPAWLEPPTSVTLGFSFVASLITPGWGGYAYLDKDLVLLTESERSSLLIDEDCGS